MLCNLPNQKRLPRPQALAVWLLNALWSDEASAAVDAILAHFHAFFNYDNFTRDNERQRERFSLWFSRPFVGFASLKSRNQAFQFIHWL